MLALLTTTATLGKEKGPELKWTSGQHRDNRPLIRPALLFAFEFWQLSCQDGRQAHSALRVHGGPLELLKPQHRHQRVLLAVGDRETVTEPSDESPPVGERPT